MQIYVPNINNWTTVYCTHRCTCTLSVQSSSTHAYLRTQNLKPVLCQHDDKVSFVYVDWRQAACGNKVEASDRPESNLMITRWLALHTASEHNRVACEWVKWGRLPASHRSHGLNPPHVSANEIQGRGYRHQSWISRVNGSRRVARGGGGVRVRWGIFFNSRGNYLSAVSNKLCLILLYKI
jgi:hypothetical protein